VKLRYAKRAAAQIEAALAYVAERSPQGASHMAQRLGVLFTLLTEQPHAGQATTRPGVRRLPANPYPYAIDYRANDTEIVILRFRHSARRPLG
jgi:plasmid stabilization system protein ParE